MKKIIFSLFLMIILILPGNAQVSSRALQPMAVLPSNMQYAVGENVLNTLCLDLFAETPVADDIYKHVIFNTNADKREKIIRKFDKGWQIEGIESVYEMTLLNHKSKQIDLDNKEIFVIHDTEEKLPIRFTEFVNKKTAIYGKSKFDFEAHEKLQNEVWTYNALEDLGYLSGEGAVLDDYNNAIKLFEREFPSINSEDQITILELMAIDQLNKGIEQEKIFFIQYNLADESYTLFHSRSQPFQKINNIADLADLINSVQKNEELLLLNCNGLNQKAKIEFITQLKNEFSKKNFDPEKVYNEEHYIATEILPVLFNTEAIGDLSKYSFNIDESIKIKVKNSDDFKEIVESNTEVCKPSLCITNEGDISVSIDCGLFSIEISSEQDVIFEISAGDETFSFSTNEQENDCNYSSSICIGQNEISGDVSFECSDGNKSISSEFVSWKIVNN